MKQTKLMVMAMMAVALMATSCASREGSSELPE